VRDKGIAKQFQCTKNVAEKKRTKGASPTAFFRSPSRESGEAHTDLLSAGFSAFYYVPHLTNLSSGQLLAHSIADFSPDKYPLTKSQRFNVKS